MDLYIHGSKTKGTSYAFVVLQKKPKKKKTFVALLLLRVSLTSHIGLLTIASTHSCYFFFFFFFVIGEKRFTEQKLNKGTQMGKKEENCLC